MLLEFLSFFGGGGGGGGGGGRVFTLVDPRWALGIYTPFPIQFFYFLAGFGKKNLT